MITKITSHGQDRSLGLHSDEEKLESVNSKHKKRQLRAEEKQQNKGNGNKEESFIKPPRYTHMHSHL